MFTGFAARLNIGFALVHKCCAAGGGGQDQRIVVTTPTAAVLPAAGQHAEFQLQNFMITR